MTWHWKGDEAARKGNLILFGVKGKLANEAEVVALCVQTSDMTMALHSINTDTVSMFHDPAWKKQNVCARPDSENWKHIWVVLTPGYKYKYLRSE